MNEVGVLDSIYYGIIVLLGEEGEHWEYYEGDSEWWELKLWTRRN